MASVYVHMMRTSGSVFSSGWEPLWLCDILLTIWYVVQGDLTRLKRRTNRGLYI